MSLNDLAERIEHLIAEVNRLHTRLDTIEACNEREKNEEATRKLNKEIKEKNRSLRNWLGM